MSYFWQLAINPKFNNFLSGYTDSYAKIFLILYPLLKNSRTRIAIKCQFVSFSCNYGWIPAHSQYGNEKHHQWPIRVALFKWSLCIWNRVAWWEKTHSPICSRLMRRRLILWTWVSWSWQHSEIRHHPQFKKKFG